MDKDQFLNIVIFILLGFVIYKCFFEEKQVQSVQQPFQQTHQPKNNKPFTLYLFYADWCGHCKSFKPEWTKVENKLADSHLITKKINGDSNQKEDLELIKKYNVQGFPTIIFSLPDDTSFMYNGARTSDDLLKATENQIRNGDPNFEKI